MRPLFRMVGPLAALTFMVACSDTPVSFQPDEAGDLVAQKQARLVSPAVIENAPAVTVPGLVQFLKPLAMIGIAYVGVVFGVPAIMQAMSDTKRSRERAA